MMLRVKVRNWKPAVMKNVTPYHAGAAACDPPSPPLCSTCFCLLRRRQGGPFRCQDKQGSSSFPPLSNTETSPSLVK